jgi:hypothetical protein
LTATASTSPPWIATTEGPGLTDPNDPGRDPRFRKLVEAILYSRRFLATYNYVLVGILIVFTAWHWGEKAALARRRRRDAQLRKREETVDESWSSSSSTVEGTSTPPDAVKSKVSKDETTPLLSTTTPKRANMGLKKPYYLLKSSLQYQPPPIPYINKTLPPNSVSLLVLSFLLLNIFYNLYCMPLSMMYLFVFADRCGILFVVNLPLLYLLAAKNQPIKFLTGYSYESLNIFHRRAGELLCFEAFLHLAGMVTVWYGLLRHLGFTLARFLFNRVVGLGLGAFVAYEVLYFTSLGSFRVRWYEIFLALHVFLQFAGLVLLWFHHNTSRPYVGISLVIFVVDRLVFRFWLKTSSHPATLTILEDDETVLLSANWDIVPSSTFSTLTPKSMVKGWKPNDHVFLTIPSLGPSFALQSHPFTIFSAAPEIADSDSDIIPSHAFFTLLIRAQSPEGFASKLLEHARTHTKTEIRLDGPYGSSHALDILEASDTVVVVAGGSGIAVAYPLLWALLHTTASNSATDVEVQRSSSSSSSSRSKKRVKLLWITHSESHRRWVPEHNMRELQSWGLEVLIPEPTSIVGRPDTGKILREWTEHECGRTGVVVSGPDGLVRNIRNTCAGLIKIGENVSVQAEKFGW